MNNNPSDTINSILDLVAKRVYTISITNCYNMEWRLHYKHLFFVRGIWQANPTLKGKAFEHNFGPGGKNLNKPIFKSSNAWGAEV